MSRRASLFKKQNPGKPRVRFSDELVLEDCVKENDVHELHAMLRRRAVGKQLDLNAIGISGLTPLHQAVLDGNFTAARLFLKHGARVNERDEDSWTPLHAACAVGHASIARYLLKKGADSSLRTPDGERPIDLCDPNDFATIRVLLSGLYEQTLNGVSDDVGTAADGDVGSD